MHTQTEPMVNYCVPVVNVAKFKTFDIIANNIFWKFCESVTVAAKLS